MYIYIPMRCRFFPPFLEMNVGYTGVFRKTVYPQIRAENGENELLNPGMAWWYLDFRQTHMVYLTLTTVKSSFLRVKNISKNKDMKRQVGM